MEGVNAYLLALGECRVVPERDSLGKLVGTFSFVELLLDGLPVLAIIVVLQDEVALDDFPKLLQCLVQRVLVGIGIQAFEELGSGRHLEPDGGDEAQDFIPLFFDEVGADGMVWQQDETLLLIMFARFEGRKPLFPQPLDA
jgi:hypothetical protein